VGMERVSVARPIATNAKYCYSMKDKLKGTTMQTIFDTLAAFWTQTPVKMWLGFLAVGLCAEVFFSAEKGQPLRDILFNVRYSLIYLAVIFIGSPTISTATSQIAQYLGAGWINLDVFSQDNVLSQIAAALLLMFCVDFFYYWWHRTQHKVSWLWDQHALHHSDESLNVSTSMRHHWSEFIFQGFVVSLPMAILFKMTPVSMWTVSTVIAFWSWFIHLNVKLHLGRFSWLIAGPQLHRIHHSAERKHYDKNFAAYFPIWDVLFGSYYAPQRDEYPKTGIPEGPVATVAEASVYPFARWARRLAKKRAVSD
jgi:sterol desaturase/sphingolipid hydroxylase (fatty acid hydroxylase superfamily)